MKGKRAKMGTESTREFGITVMLVSAATLFLMLRIPEMILFQMMKYFTSNNMARHVIGNVMIVYPLFLILVTINHALNFIVYIIFFRQFRNTFIFLSSFM